MFIFMKIDFWDFNVYVEILFFIIIILNRFILHF